MTEALNAAREALARKQEHDQLASEYKAHWEAQKAAADKLRDSLRQLNAKIEQYFRTMKIWMRSTWLVPTQPRMQSRLDQYKAWYNQHRVHGAHEAHTPQDRISGVEPEPILYTARGDRIPEISVSRHNARGDPKLFRLAIRVRELRRAA